MTDQYLKEAETLVSDWEKANMLPMGQPSRPVLVKAVAATLSAFDPFANEAQSTFWTMYKNKVDDAAHLYAEDCANCLKAYDDILAKLQGQNPPQPNHLQASIAWHQERGLLPSQG